MTPDELRIRNLEDRLDLMQDMGKGDSPAARRIAEQLEKIIDGEDGEDK